MRYRITGAPEPEVAAAIVAAIEAVLGRQGPPSVPPVSTWRSAGIRDNLRQMSPPRPGGAWRTTTESP